MKRHPAGTATYEGDASHMVGEVKGPTAFGSLLVAVDAVYDFEADLTVVTFATCTDDDLDAIIASGVGRVEVTA